MSTKSVGDRGEALAAAFLEERGYRVLERNYRYERAEVDLVCFLPADDYEAGGQLVFVEVKTRTGVGFGAPEDAVTPEKQRQLRKAAEAYLHERRLEGSPARFDVVAVVLHGAGEPAIEHFPDAFSFFGWW